VSRFQYLSTAPTKWLLREVNSVGITGCPVIYFPGVTQGGAIDSNGPIIHFSRDENHWFGVFPENIKIFQETENVVGVFCGNRFYRINLDQPQEAFQMDLYVFDSHGDIRYAGQKTYFLGRQDGIYRFGQEGISQLMDMNEHYNEFSFTAFIKEWAAVSEGFLDIIVNDDSDQSWHVTIDAREGTFVNTIKLAE